MSDTPEKGEALPADAAAEQLGALLFAEMDEESSERSTPSDDDKEAQEAKSEAESDDDTSGEDDEADTEEDEATEDDTEETDDAQDDAQPVMAGDDAIVTLSDGSQTTVGDLKAGSLREGDYIRKTQEVAAQRKEAEELKADFTQQTQALATERQQMATVLQALMPQKPDSDMLETDPIGYWQAKEAYEERMGQIQGLIANEEKAHKEAAEKQKAEMQEHLQREQQALLQAMPEFKDRAVHQKFWNDAQSYLGSQGFNEQEIQTVSDHRFFKVLKDAMAYQQLQQAKPKAKAKAEGKPAVMNADRRKGRKSAASKDVMDRIARAEKSGNVKSVSDLLGDLLLAED